MNAEHTEALIQDQIGVACRRHGTRVVFTPVAGELPPNSFRFAASYDCTWLKRWWLAVASIAALFTGAYCAGIVLWCDLFGVPIDGWPLASELVVYTGVIPVVIRAIKCPVGDFAKLQGEIAAIINKTGLQVVHGPPPGSAEA
jgi:hypothetical protein